MWKKPETQPPGHKNHRDNPQPLRTCGRSEQNKGITGAKVAIHPADADYIQGKAEHVGGNFMNALIKIFQVIYQTKPFEPEILLKDNDIIGGYQVIHPPGHSTGSIYLYNPQKQGNLCG